MVPNSDLILLAFLHGTFISCILLVVIFAIVNGLLLAFLISLFFFALVDIYDNSELLRPYLETLRANLKLGVVLALIIVLHRGFLFVSYIKTWLRNVLGGFKSKPL